MTGTGGGGGGGAGVILRNGKLTNAAGSTIRGGNGGGGGWDDISTQDHSLKGGGGGAGDGVVVDKNGTFINYGTVEGGKGGKTVSTAYDRDDTESRNRRTGRAGSGIRIGESGYVINAGTVKHGAKAEGDTRPDVNAIDVVGDHSTLELWDGSNIEGNVVVADGVKDTSLVLGGEKDSSLDASELGDKYKGFDNFKKTGASKWDLTGKTDAHTPWTIAEGILSITEDGSLGNAADTLTIDGGTLQTAGTFDMTRNVVIGDKNGTIDTQGNTNTMNGVISGAGSLTKDGDGVLVLAGVNTFTGDAKIDKGELRLAGNGSIASAARVDNNGVFDISGVDPDSASVKSLAGGESGHVKTGDKTLVITDAKDTFAGVIEGDGGIKVDGGKETLSGENTFTGDATVSKGAELDMVGKGSIASAERLNNNGTFDISGVDPDTASIKSLAGDENGHVKTGDKTLIITDAKDAFAGSIDGNGGLKIDGGKQTLSGDNSFTGEASVAKGAELDLAGKGSIASADRLNNNGIFDISGVDPDSATVKSLKGDDTGLVKTGDKKLVIADAKNDTFAGVIEGNGKVEVAGGTQRFTGDNTYTGGTQVDKPGTLIIGDGGTKGSVKGEIDNAGALVYDRSDKFVINPIKGDGSVEIRGGGSAAIDGKQEFTGETTVAENNTLVIEGNGDISNSSGITNNGTVDISGINADDIHTKHIAGKDTGKFDIGGKTIVITDGNGSEFAGVIDGTGGLSIDKGKQIISGDNTYTGDTKIASAGELQLGNDERAGSITSNVINDGILSGNGSMNGLVNRGTVSPGTDKTFGTLTVNGDYASENGKLVMHQVLGDDNSQGDRLVVKGNTSGTTEVSVINRGGMGAQTVNGIKIIEVGGQSDGQFNLHGDYVNYNKQQAVVAGAYAYTLNKGGVSTPNDGNWYLRSEDKNKKGENGNGGNGGNGGKEYQAGVPVYGGISSALAGINRAGFASFGTRMSSSGSNGNANAYSIANPDSLFGEKYVWGRIQTGYSRLTPSGNATGAVYGSNDWTMQAGLDGQFIDDQNGDLFGSIWLDYTSSSIKSRSDIGNGHVSVKGYGLGGALTWYGENGYYIDGQGKLTWYKSDLESDLVQQALATGVKSFGYALSLEAGQKFVVSDQWSVTPQVQLIWSSLNTDNYVDIFSAAIDTPDNRVLTGRFGIAANFAQSWLEADGTRTKLDFGGIANIYQDLKSGPNYINVSDVKIATGSTDKTWGELGLTADYSWKDDTYSVFGKVSTATSLQNVGKSYSVSGSLGFKVKW
ncbi:autotransporter outer membrane beta-barrel domain-containing protein [Ochrobactrum teleogrylli]|nr:autotransporter outer membrane beta-barrel domain-containing protein [[Ochrobactrum] teleogrylli]